VNAKLREFKGIKKPVNYTPICLGSYIFLVKEYKHLIES